MFDISHQANGIVSEKEHLFMPKAKDTKIKSERKQSIVAVFCAAGRVSKVFANITADYRSFFWLSAPIIFQGKYNED